MLWKKKNPEFYGFKIREDNLRIYLKEKILVSDNIAEKLVSGHSSQDNLGETGPLFKKGNRV